MDYKNKRYKFVVVDGKTTYEHIIVAEQMLGRKLNSGECVHHIDHDRKNNTPENLMVFATLADHARYHCGIPAYKDGDVWKTDVPTNTCVYCGKQFIPDYSNQKHCSKKCEQNSKLLRMKAPVPIEDIIRALQETNGNFLAVSRMFGVSDNAIRKRCRHAGFPYHSIDYRATVSK